jgi:predicted permease
MLRPNWCTQPACTFHLLLALLLALVLALFAVLPPDSSLYPVSAEASAIIAKILVVFGFIKQSPRLNLL